MSGKYLASGVLAAILFAVTGCCRWCERHCQPPVSCCPTYAAPQACCPAPAAAPACCPAPAQYAPQAQYAPPPQQWQRTFSSPQNCSCQ
jgi:hypothetical protein